MAVTSSSVRRFASMSSLNNDEAGVPSAAAGIGGRHQPPAGGGGATVPMAVRPNKAAALRVRHSTNTAAGPGPAMMKVKEISNFII
jgi:hypothetical protein